MTNVEIAIKARNEVTQAVRGAQRELQGLSSTMQSLNAMMGKVGMGLGVGAVAMGLQKALRDGIAYNAQLEQQTLAFQTLLGTAEAAERRMRDLREFARATPFELPEIVEASRVLQSLTGGALASGDALRLVGDAAAASGRSFQETAMWVGRLYAGLEAGRPVGQATMALMQMGVISVETAQKLNAMAESGEGVGNAMKVVRETFAGTAGAMELQANTLNGAVSNLTGAFQELKGVLAQPLMDPLRTSVELTTRAVDKLNQVFESSAFLRTIWGMAMGRTALDGAIDSVRRMGKEMASLNAEGRELDERLAELNKKPVMAYDPDRSKLPGEGDPFWVEEDMFHALRDMEEMNRLIEQGNAERQRAVDLAARDAELIRERAQWMSTVGGTQMRYDEWQRAAALDDQAGMGGGMVAGMQQALMDLGTVASNAANMVRGTIGSAIDSLSAGISGLVLGTETWASALRKIGSSVINEVIQGIVRMTAAWIAQRLTRSKVDMAASGAEAAAAAPGALMTSITSFGVAAAIGAAAFLGAMALTGGFREGGYTGDGPRDEPAGIVHRGEFVVPAPVVARLGRPTLEAMSAGPGTAGVSGGSAGRAGGDGGVRASNIHVYMDRSAWLEASRDDIEGIAVDAMRRMRG